LVDVGFRLGQRIGGGDGETEEWKYFWECFHKRDLSGEISHRL
jgi:hypothetical protein